LIGPLVSDSFKGNRPLKSIH